MKNLFHVLVLIVSIALTMTSVQAGTPKFPDNPDRYTSVSFSGFYQNGSGEGKTTDILGVSASRDLVPSGLGVGISFKAPTSSSTSIWANLSYLSTELEGEETPFYNKYESQLTTFSFSAGLTIYFIGE